MGGYRWKLIDVRTLIIVRHAHAEKQHHDLEDFERELDHRGRREAKEMAALAKRLRLSTDHMVTSTATRTVSTAREFAKALEFPLSQVRHDHRLYLATRSTIASVISSLPATCHRALVIGHNPGLSQFAAWLVDDDCIGDLPTAAVCVLKLDIPEWGALGRGGATLKALQTP